MSMFDSQTFIKWRTRSAKALPRSVDAHRREVIERVEEEAVDEVSGQPWYAEEGAKGAHEWVENAEEDDGGEDVNEFHQLGHLCLDEVDLLGGVSQLFVLSGLQLCETGT